MHEFTLPDADGDLHTYQVIARHKVDEGYKLMRRLQALIAGPLGGLIDGLAGKGGNTGADLTRALDSIQDMGLAKQLLAHTTRDGIPMFGPTSAKSFNDAYQGNYLELDLACFEVIKHNRFLSLPAGMSGVLRLIQAKVQAKMVAMDAGAETSSEPPPSA